MNKNTLKINNKIEITFFVLVLSILFIIITIAPLVFIQYFKLSSYSVMFTDNIIYIIITGSILIYYLANQYYYNIEIDQYSIQITSYRFLFSLFSKRKNLDITHSMLDEYQFSNRMFSFKHIMSLKIKTSRGKKFIKKFNLSLISTTNISRVNKHLRLTLGKKNNARR